MTNTNTNFTDNDFDAAFSLVHVVLNVDTASGSAEGAFGFFYPVCSDTYNTFNTLAEVTNFVVTEVEKAEVKAKAKA